MSVTTQAAERIYRAVGPERGIVRTKLRAEKDAQLYWLPQETILFDGARLDRSLVVDLHKSAKFLMVEPLVFGRDASGETLKSGALLDRVSITSDGAPVYCDRIKLEGDIGGQLARRAVANGAGAAASIVLVDQSAQSMLTAVRDLLPPMAGASDTARKRQTDGGDGCRGGAQTIGARRKAELPRSDCADHGCGG